MRDTLDEFLNFSRPLGDLMLEQIDALELMEELTALHDGLTQSRGIAVRVARPAIRSRSRPIGASSSRR